MEYYMLIFCSTAGIPPVSSSGSYAFILKRGIFLKSFLLTLGSSAERSLATVFSAFSSGAVRPCSDLHVFHLGPSAGHELLSAIAEDYSLCHRLFSVVPSAGADLFRCSFTFTSEVPDLPGPDTLGRTPSARLLLDALRGSNRPLSYRTDAEAVQWAFTCWLKDSSTRLVSWLDEILNSPDDEPYCLAVLADISDPWSSGASLSILQFLDTRLNGDFSRVCFISLVKANLSAVRDGSVNTFLRHLETLGIAGSLSDSGSFRMVSLPESLPPESDGWRIVFFSVAGMLSDAFRPDTPAAPGIHFDTVQAPPVLTCLKDRAVPFASVILSAAWFLCDASPLLTTRGTAARRTGPSLRSSVLKKVFPDESSFTPEELAVLDRSLRTVLLEALSLIRSLPASFRISSSSEKQWNQALDACGRFVTLASRLEISREEAAESGVDKVMPVHRESMADTEEEKLLRSLDELADQTDEAESARNECLSVIGLFRARQALRSCREKCISARSSAANHLQVLLQDDSAEPFQVASLSRRIRLLDAAIARCDLDLERFSHPDLAPVRTKTSETATFTFDDQSVFSVPAAEALWSFLTCPETNREETFRFVKETFPSLFSDFSLPELKALKKKLRSCSFPDGHPLARFFLGLTAVCRSCIEDLPPPASPDLPPTPLLPDPISPDLYTFPTFAQFRALFPAGSDLPADLDEQWGLLAMILLRQFRRPSSGEALLRLDCLSPEDSSFVECWLSGHGLKSAWVVSLSSQNTSLPFAVILPGDTAAYDSSGLIPARRFGSHLSLVPRFATWFDRSENRFHSPLPNLTETDTQILLSRMRILSVTFPCFHPFLEALEKPRENLPEDSFFETRLRAVCGLRFLPAYHSALCREKVYYERNLERDGILSCFLSRETEAPDLPVPEEILYLYRDVPFARESAACLLESVSSSDEEKYILSMLRTECDMLQQRSDDFRDAVARELPLLMRRFPGIDPNRLSRAERVLLQAREPVPDSGVSFTWPWDPLSPSMQTLFSECLGDKLAEAALSPFSEKLILFPAHSGDLIGDALLSRICTVPPTMTQPDAVAESLPDTALPPLSRSLSMSLVRSPEGKTLLQEGFLHFDRLEGNTIRAELTLEGAFTLSLSRVYSEDSQILLYSHDMPTLALWPSLPFPPERWRAYYLYARFPESVRAESIFANRSDPVPLSVNNRRFVLPAASYPQGFLFTDRDGASAGFLPNLLPSPAEERSGAVTACLDFGSSAVSVVLASENRFLPLQGPVMVRVLLNHPAQSADLLRREFIPAVPVSAVIPSVICRFSTSRDTGHVFEDGMILMSANLRDVLSLPSDSLCYGLKWEEDEGEALSLCLHQIMLMVSLEVRKQGAESLSWRFSLPDEMAPEGREKLARLLLSLSDQVSYESGYDLFPPEVPVSFYSESSALGSYFRYCSPEDTRGGFMTLDLGSSTADISLFLRGRQEAVRICQLPLGLHYMLLPTLLKHPDILLRDFGFVRDESFLQDLNSMSGILKNASSDPASLRHSRLTIDHFVSDHHALLHSVLIHRRSEGAPGITGALVLLHLSYLMMLSGLILLQLSADPNKNDFLPEQMTLCLAGRASRLMERLSEHVRASLWRFLTMFRNPRVASLSLLFSSEKKLEIPAGLSLLPVSGPDLPSAPPAPSSVAVRPEELLPEFLIRFSREFPPEAALLFGGFFTNDFYHPFTSRGESVITAITDHVFSGRGSLRPYDALSRWIADLMEFVSDSFRSPLQ